MWGRSRRLCVCVCVLSEEKDQEHSCYIRDSKRVRTLSTQEVTASSTWRDMTDSAQDFKFTMREMRRRVVW